MSYRIEGSDIVISGFDQGIANSPYEGIADMRNIEILSVPGEASIEYANISATLPPKITAIAFTAVASTDIFTYGSGHAGQIYEGMALFFNTNSAGGVSTNTPYYALNVTSTTFQIKIAPGINTPVNVTSNGSGTFTSYQYGNQRTGSLLRVPVSYFVDRQGSFGGHNAIVLVDASNYVWIMLSANDATGVQANHLIFAGNIGGVGASGTIESAVGIWNGYLLLLGSTHIDYVKCSDLWSAGPTASWFYTWETITTNATNGRIGLIVAQEDGNLYWTSADGLGSIIEQPGAVFDPTNATTYSITNDAVQVPDSDEATCIAELGSNLLIGGQRSFIYVWDKISLGFTGLLNIPDVFTYAIVAASQNAYAFSGNRGRIYITNGSGIDLYKKVSDYVTGLSNASFGSQSPFIQWQDANFSRNQLIFGFNSFNAGGAQENTTAGAWAIDLDTDAMRLLQKTTNTTLSGSGDYAGLTAMVVEQPPPTSGQFSTVKGQELAVGWSDPTNALYGVDVGNSVPYSNWEAYIETDMIPIGTYLDPFTGSQIEWKVSAPLLFAEGVRISFRPSFDVAYAVVKETTGKPGIVSDVFKVNFQKSQWGQFLIELKGEGDSSATFTRFTELRIRDFPSGKNNKRQ